MYLVTGADDDRGAGWVILGLPRDLFYTENQEDLPRNPDHLVMRYLVGRSEPRVALLTASFDTDEYFVWFSEEVRIEVPPEQAVELLADGSPVACPRGNGTDSTERCRARKDIRS